MLSPTDPRDLSGLIRIGPGGDARIRRIAPNPTGGIDVLYAIDGDFTAGPAGALHAEAASDIPPCQPPAKSLRLFHVNDMHNHLCDTDSAGGLAHNLAQMVQRIRNARAVAGPGEAVVFLSAGDDHTGTVLDELVGWSARDFVLDPGYRALSAAGLDAAAIGNHEFDRGTAQLVRGISDAAFPLVSANVHSSAHLHPGRHYHAALIAQVKGLRIGLIGLTTRVETRVGQPGDPGLTVASPVQVLANTLPLVAKLADVIVILSHCGYGDGSHVSGKAAVARDIGEADFALADTAAELCDKPMVLIGAHTHTRLNEHGVEPENLRAGILLTQAEANGRFLGEILLDATGARSAEARLHPIVAADDARPREYDADFAETHIAPIIERVSQRMAEVIGTASGAALAWERTRVSRYVGECALANFMTDGLVAQLAGLPEGAPDLALLNGGSILSGVGAGEVTFGQWFDVMPYSDEVFLLKATGRQIAALLQSNARRILRPEEVPVTDTGGFVARGFLHASGGLRYRIGLGESAAEARATDIQLFGRPVEDQLDDTFTIAVTTYLALGSFGERWNGAPLSGGIPGALAGFDLRSFERRHTGLVYRNVLVEHIRRRPRIEGGLDGRLTVKTR